MTLVLPEVRNGVELFRWRVERSGSAPALRTFPEGRVVSWREWARASEAFADRLRREGVEPGHRVAIWAGSRPLWPIADLGALMAGAVPVGLYPSSAPAQVRALLADAGVVLAVGDRPERVGLLRSLEEEVPQLVRTLDETDVDPEGAGAPGGGPGTSGAPEASPRFGAPRDTASDRWPGVEAEAGDDALLIYTSGSTGEPRGARISHRYLLTSAASVRQVLELQEGDVTLSFLPFCHAAERVFGLYTRILAGVEAVLVEDHHRVWDAARAVNPTVFGGLPRFFEKAVEGLRAHEAEGGDPADRVSHYFGTRLRVATSGGATLAPDVSAALDRLGVRVLGAYGLTEHLCATMNRPDRCDLASAGVPMPGTDLRIAEDGEILLRRGPLTFSGYLNRPADTRRAFTPDGEWLLTGDLGRVDDRGFLFVTGRKKELLALSTGKKVAPVPIETRLTRHPWITQAMLVGESRRFVSALLVPNRSVVESWARAEGIPGAWEALLVDPKIRRQVDRIVVEVNRELSRTEQVRRYHLLVDEWTTEAGELTPTLKVRRAVVAERHDEAIEAIYDAESPTADESRPRRPTHEPAQPTEETP